VKVLLNGATVQFHGCDGFKVAAGVAQFSIENGELFSLAADGSPDPKAHTAIAFQGVNTKTCVYNVCRDLYLRGWSICVDWSYTWSSRIDNVATINCDTAVRVFGQSVNNSISDSNLLANTGTCSVRTAKDGSLRGEGLSIVNCLLAQGTYGILSDGFLSMNVTNSVIDLVGDAACDFTNVQSLSIANSWLYAANYGVRYRDLNLPSSQKASLTGNTIITTAAGSRPVMIGANNYGIGIAGGALECGSAGASRCIYIEGAGCDDITAQGVNLVNPSGNASVFVGAGRFRHSGLTGNDTVQYASGAGDQYRARLTGIADADRTFTIKAHLDGDYVELEIPESLGASNTAACTITGMPSAYRPAAEQLIPAVPICNDTQALYGRVRVGTDGVLTLFNGITSTTFTASGTKGIYGCNLRYRRF